MIITSLDLARVTGFAHGPAGSVPISGSWELRQIGQPFELEAGALGRNIQKLWKEHGRATFIMVEQTLDPFAQPNSKTIKSQERLHGSIHTLAGMCGIELATVHPGTIRKAVTGKAGAGERDATKAMVMAHMKMLKMINPTSKDLDASDAVCGWCYAESFYAKLPMRFSLT